MSQELQCSFCKRFHFEVSRLVAGPQENTYLCSQCIDDFLPNPPDDMLYRPRKKKTSSNLINTFKDLLEQENSVPTHACSFCNLDYSQVDYLIANSAFRVFICKNCLEISKDAIQQDITKSNKNLKSFINQWQQQLESASENGIMYLNQKFLLRQIEDWVDARPSKAKWLMTLLDLLSETKGVSPKITKRIDLVKSEISELADQ